MQRNFCHIHTSYETLNQIKLQKNLAKTTHFQGIFYRSIIERQPYLILGAI